MKPDSPANADFPSSSSDESPSSRSQLAKRIGSRTTDLLAIAIVVAGGLSIGGDLVDWWSVDPDEASAPTEMAALATGPAVGWGEPGEPVCLEFGDSPFGIQRQELNGTREAARAELLAQCRSLVESGAQPQQPVTEAERSLLKVMENASPLEEQAGTWQIHQLERSVLTLIGSRQFGPSLPSAKTEMSAPAARRVVCWGMAFGRGRDAWLLYMFRPAEPTGTSETSLANIQLPADCRRVLSLRDAAGGAIVSFDGAGPGETWGRFFDEQFLALGWEVEHPWRISATGWSARYRATPPARRQRLEVHFYETVQNRLAGILHIVSSPNDSQAKDGP